MPDGLALVYGTSRLAAAKRSVIKVERFGRINKAEVELAPLTILVGKNNTGKSYLASLLWAIRSSEYGASPYLSESISAPDWFKEYVETAKLDTPPLEITAERISPYLNAWLDDRRNSLVADLLSLEGATCGKLEINFSGSVWLSRHKEGPGWVKNSEAFKSFVFSSWAFSADNQPVGEGIGGFISGGLNGRLPDALFGMAIVKLVGQELHGHANRAAYIPAARTGLVLALRDLAASVIGTFGIRSDEDQSGRFSKPMINFLRSIIRSAEKKTESPASEVADFLEKSIIAGQIEVSGNGPTFTYVPLDSGMRLPMHAVSSMITELTPILSILREGYVNCLVIEEPEAHLHLSAQRCMARALVKLVNRGIPVIVTTHSDTFLQQINLLLQIGRHEERDRILEFLEYDKDDALNPDDVQAYEFIQVPDGTEVRLAEKGPDGVIIQSLNETLTALVDDILAVAEQ